MPQRPAQAVGLQPHTPAVPPPLHVIHAGKPWLAQVQLSVPPQPSGKLPHWFGYAAHVFFVHWHVPDTPGVLVLHVCPVPVQLQSMVPPQPSEMSCPHWFAAHLFGVQHMPAKQVLPLAHEQSTELQALVTVVLHLPSHFGASQQLPSLQIWPLPQVKVREPQALDVVPQKVGLGRVGSEQHVPGPPLPDVEHWRPVPHEPDEQVRVPQALLTVVLHAAPSLPPQVGSAQHVPAAGGLGWLQPWPEEQPQVCVPPQPSETVPQPEPHGVFVQQVPALPTAVSEHLPFTPQEQSTVPPQPSGKSLPHWPG